MTNGEVGYYEDPKNGNGIIRARTTMQIRSWELPRVFKALERLNEEMGKVEFPGNYILFDNMKVYIGEAKNIYNRLKTHSTTPDDKVKNWNKALVMSDGRPATQSDFNDQSVRLTLESYLIKLFKANKYSVDGQKTYIRPGSPKTKGWQITFRDRFLNSLQKGDGYLLVSRDGVLLIPLKDIQKVIPDKDAYAQNTIDVYIVFKTDRVTLAYKQNVIDVTSFKLRK